MCGGGMKPCLPEADNQHADTQERHRNLTQVPNAAAAAAAARQQR